jgi:hypothetical protein
MYEDLARAVLIDEDPAASRAVERVRARHPRLSDKEVARRVAEHTAWRCAAVGAATAAGTELLDRFVAAADVSYQAVALNRLAAGIAQARGRRTTILERGATAAGSLVVAGLAAAVRRGAGRLARRALGRRAPGLVPVLSGLAGGVAAYAAAKLFARAADELFSQFSRRR